VHGKEFFKLNIGDTPNNLDEKDYKELGEKTDGFSGADIAVLIRDALYEPVRACQTATHFKKIPDSTGKQQFLWTPCSPGDSEAVEKTLMEVDSNLLKPIDITKKMVLKALKNAKPTVGKEDLQRFEEWTKQFGQEG